MYMKPYAHLWLCIAEFFLEWEIFLTEFVKKLITHYIQCLFIAEYPAIYEINVEKYGRIRRATGGNIMRRMRVANWINRTTHTHTHTHAHTHSHTHTLTHSLIIGTFYCFSTATMVTWKYLHITVRYRYISFLVIFCATEINFMNYSIRTAATRVALLSNLRLMLLKL
jgi:hypothetical protein